MDEIARRFGQQSELRRVQMESLRWLVDAAVRAGVRRVVVNGSFVTDVVEPDDVDCVLLIEAAFPKDTVAETELRIGFPFLDVQLADADTFDKLVGRFFATDRYLNPKGMIEVIL
ncbi:MAG: hypothetical protein NTW96_11705 [Planctomycetia bacterium]|nr:hypothetical protein [Planctomycetia bacterium]